MARNQERKAETRQKMLSAASRSFRSNGFSGVGVDGIAKAAGATSGAFYAHFGSKDGAFAAALDFGLDEVIEAIPKFQADFGSEWIQAFADFYLGRTHREDLECGCAMTALSPEVIRAGPKMQAAYEAKMAKIVELIATGLKGTSTEGRRARAWAMLGTLIGGLTIARAVKTRKITEEVATAIRNAAVDVAGEVKKLPKGLT